jgi:hypothetical protein
MSLQEVLTKSCARYVHRTAYTASGMEGSCIVNGSNAEVILSGGGFFRETASTVTAEYQVVYVAKVMVMPDFNAGANLASVLDEMRARVSSDSDTVLAAGAAVQRLAARADEEIDAWAETLADDLASIHD